MNVRGKYSFCEHCDKDKREGEILFVVEYWATSAKDGRRRPSYWYVCDDCYKTRWQWCTGVFPDNCEKCDAEIEAGDHCLEKKTNRQGEYLSVGGLAPDETCRVVCENCANPN